MLFVSGLMGPYMSPIPANASAAMIFSFFVAVMRHALADAEDRRPGGPRSRRMPRRTAAGSARLYACRRRGRSSPAKTAQPGSSCSWSASLTLASLALFYTEHVTVKLLPFDNKSELSVVIDLPEGHRSRRPTGCCSDVAELAAGMPEVVSHADLCRHRRAIRLQRPGPPLLPAQRAADGRRRDQSHSEGRARAPQPRDRARTCASASTSLRVPAGTSSRWSSRRRGRRCWRPCWPRSTVPTPDTRRAVAAKVEEAFASVPYHRRYRQFLRGAARAAAHRPSTRTKLEFYQVSTGDVLRHHLRSSTAGATVGYSHRGGGRQPIADPHRAAQGRAGGRRAVPDHADARQRAARRARHRGTGRCGRR